MGRSDALPDHGQAAVMRLPRWPADRPAHGRISLRAVEGRDIPMARELSTDPYVPQAGSLPGNATEQEAGAWVERQRRRHSEGAGFSFTIARRSGDVAIGHCGLWLKELGEGRATAGYAITPSMRNQGYASEALTALTEFAWTVFGLHRIVLFIEPWNSASLRTAERVGYLREGVLDSHQMIGGESRDVILYAAIRPNAGSERNGG